MALHPLLLQQSASAGSVVASAAASALSLSPGATAASVASAASQHLLQEPLQQLLLGGFCQEPLQQLLHPPLPPAVATAAAGLAKAEGKSVTGVARLQPAAAAASIIGVSPSAAAVQPARLLLLLKELHLQWNQLCCKSCCWQVIRCRLWSCRCVWWWCTRQCECQPPGARSWLLALDQEQQSAGAAAATTKSTST